MSIRSLTAAFALLSLNVLSFVPDASATPAPAKTAAAEKTQAPATPPPSPLDAAFAAARKTLTAGPADIPFADQAVLHLPVGFVYIPPAEAAGVMTAMGNRAGTNLLGLIFPAGDGNWFMVARFENIGYVRDDDAKDWNADELLQNIKDGTAEGNKDRAARNIPALEVLGWAEAPRYDAATHRLVWSISAQDQGAPPDAAKNINYNTYALGRDGYISLNLITDLSAIAVEKPIAQQLLAALDFNEGKRYADFNEATDHVAEYGLAALVGGVAAKKLGLFALIAAFFAKFFKIIALAVAGAGVLGLQWWKKKKANATPAAPPTNNPNQE